MSALTVTGGSEADGLIAGFVHLPLGQSVYQGRNTVNVHFKFSVQLQFVNYFCM